MIISRPPHVEHWAELVEHRAISHRIAGVLKQASSFRFVSGVTLSLFLSTLVFASTSLSSSFILSLLAFTMYLGGYLEWVLSQFTFVFLVIRISVLELFVRTGQLLVLAKRDLVLDLIVYKVISGVVSE